MKLKTTFGRLIASTALAASVTALVVACGGGGGSGSVGGGGGVSTPVDPNAALNSAASEFAVNASDFTGDAAGGDGGAGGAGGSAGDGAPIKRAVVVMTDKTGIQKIGETDDNGNYLIATRQAMKAPIVLKVIEASGKVLTSVINEDITPGVFKRVMINPLTDKIVSDTLQAGVLGTDKNFDGSKIDPSKLQKAVEDLRASVVGSLASVGVTSTATFNPISDKYAYNGKGVDAVIESISHQRDPATGSTQLAVKVSSATDANGVAQPVLITAASPLPADKVITSSSAEMTYDKLNNLVTEINYCLSTAGSTDAAVLARCRVNDGRNILISSSYKNSSMDALEDFRTLFSEANFDAVKGSTFRNPVILFTGNYPNSTATYNDMAIVEFTIRQPRTGPRAYNVLGEALEYSKVVTFKRDDSLTQSKAGNWIMHGNQRNYDAGVGTSVRKFTQLNPLSDTDLYANHTSSAIRTHINAEKYDVATQQWVPNGLRAVRITGPGLPTAGVVYAHKSHCGLATYMPLLNTTGAVGVTPALATNAGTDVYLGRVKADGSPLGYRSFGPTASGFTTSAGFGTGTYISDFSNLRAFSLYKMEYFLSANTTGIADSVEYSRNLSAVPTPLSVWNLPYNEHASTNSMFKLLSEGVAPGGTSHNFSWINNPLAQEVSSVGIYAEQGDPVGTLPTVNGTRYWNYFPKYGVPNARVLSARPTSYTMNMDTTATTNCQYGNLPETKAGVHRDYRESTIWSSHSRMRVGNILRWDNPYHTTTVAFPAAVAPAANTLQAYQASSAATASTVSLAMTINIGTFTGVINSFAGTSSTGEGVYVRRGTNFNPSSIQIGSSSPISVTTTNYTVFNDPVKLYTNATTTLNEFNASAGAVLPIGLTLRDVNGNYWSGIIKGKTFTGIYSVPLTGSTAGIPGSWNRFSVNVTMNFY